MNQGAKLALATVLGLSSAAACGTTENTPASSGGVPRPTAGAAGSELGAAGTTGSAGQAGTGSAMGLSGASARAGSGGGPNGGTAGSVFSGAGNNSDAGQSGGSSGNGGATSGSAGSGGVGGQPSGGAPSTGQPWTQLFNGLDLNDWIPKFAGSAVGVNYKNTFRVVGKSLVVNYDQYQTWNGEFGHLFYKTRFSRYRLRAEYRFVGTQVSGGVSWGYLNNGFMIHAQAPESMQLNQQFPVSLEVKLFGDDGSVAAQGSEPRTSGKICTPGTDVRIAGKLTLNQHCVETSTFHHPPTEWVTIEVEVLGNTRITHTQNGIVTAEYSEPQLDPNDPNAERVYAQNLLDAGSPKLLSEGYIAIQSETHPTEFRKIELQIIDP